MQILTVSQIRDWDNFTIENEPISSLNLMERAAQTFCDWFMLKFQKEKKSIKIFCGIGNNGGDGLAIARILQLNDYQVAIFILEISKKCSIDFQANLDRAKKTNGLKIRHLEKEESLENFNDTIIIDALFGSGLNRPIEGKGSNLIEKLNQANAIRISIDIPSGMLADKVSEGLIIHADFTYSFQIPKLAFLFPDNQNFTGEIIIGDIKLHSDYLKTFSSNHFYLTKFFVQSILKKRKRFSHKGTFGHAILFAGSYGMIGAAILTAKACLRSGAGLVTIHAPKCAYQILQIAFPEAMVEVDQHEFLFTENHDLSKYHSVGIGPGLGTNLLTIQAFSNLIKKANRPLIIDADGLNILSKENQLLKEIPENSILSPHPKEFERLFGTTANNFDRLNLLIQKAKEFHIYIILKGANTAIVCPDGKVFFNSTGNPGMATAGSGDVLTGILTGLFAQNYSSESTAILGVFLHGLAGDIAAEALQQESLLASDIIDHLGKAFKELRNRN